MEMSREYDESHRICRALEQNRTMSYKRRHIRGSSKLRPPEKNPEIDAVDQAIPSYPSKMLKVDSDAIISMPISSKKRTKLGYAYRFMIT